jgi:hypothetical protein
VICGRYCRARDRGEPAVAQRCQRRVTRRVGVQVGTERYRRCHRGVSIVEQPAPAWACHGGRAMPCAWSGVARRRVARRRRNAPEPARPWPTVGWLPRRRGSGTGLRGEEPASRAMTASVVQHRGLSASAGKPGRRVAATRLRRDPSGRRRLAQVRGTSAQAGEGCRSSTGAQAGDGCRRGGVLVLIGQRSRTAGRACRR